MAEPAKEPVVDDDVDTKATFTSLQVLLESLALFDLQVITSNPLRIWKHDPSKKQDNWKPDTTQYSCGAEVQISDVKRVTGISGKGWNESSEYWLGKTDENKWVRLINFRGMATAIPHMKNFKARVGGVVGKVNDIQQMLAEEVDRRKTAELRMRSAEKRMEEVDTAKDLAEKRVQEIEARLREIEKMQQEKEEINEKTVKLAKAEATEAKVLMKYFENRMKDSENNYITCEAHYDEAQEALKRMENQLAASDKSMAELKKALEVSERQRLKLIQDAEKTEVAGEKSEAGSVASRKKPTRKASAAIGKKEVAQGKKDKKEAKKKPTRGSRPSLRKKKKAKPTAEAADASEGGTEAPEETDAVVE